MLSCLTRCRIYRIKSMIHGSASLIPRCLPIGSSNSVVNSSGRIRRHWSVDEVLSFFDWFDPIYKTSDWMWRVD